jgi:Icc-related predicted phosphoesterase
MKLWVLSDLHLDVNLRYPLALPDPRPEHDAVIIAGDVCRAIGEAVRFISEVGLNTKPVVYVAGNHEFYGLDRHAELSAGRAQAAVASNVHLLERDSVIIGGVEFIGCTLWTDYLYAGAAEQMRAMLWAAQHLNDHRLIANGARRWSPQDCLDEHTASRAWLASQLKRRGRHPKAVVTHHAPSPRSVQPKYRDDLLTAAFASNLDDLVSEAALWVHGHIHGSSDYVLDDCRVVANPRGYVGLREDGAFDSALVVGMPTA